MNTIVNLSAKQLRQAAALKEIIDALEAELASVLGMPSTATAGAPVRRKMSAAAIAKIRAAQKARWARVKGVGRKPRRKMSASAKARLAAIARARWKQAKAQGKTTL